MHVRHQCAPVNEKSILLLWLTSIILTRQNFITIERTTNYLLLRIYHTQVCRALWENTVYMFAYSVVILKKMKVVFTQISKVTVLCRFIINSLPKLNMSIILATFRLILLVSPPAAVSHHHDNMPLQSSQLNPSPLSLL